MKTYYISPSSVPSRSANLIHVISMCKAFEQLGYEVSLFLHSSFLNSRKSDEFITKKFSNKNSNYKIFYYKSIFRKGIEIGIALRALFQLIYDKLYLKEPKYIISRNIYAAFLLSKFFSQKIIYETHIVERGVRKLLQKSLLFNSKVKSIVISKALANLICNEYNSKKSDIFVLHDAAQSGRRLLSEKSKYKLQKEVYSSKIRKYNKLIGYFGHLYPGRGIEIIEQLANVLDKYAFIVYGGNEKDIKYRKNKCKSKNLFYMGHIAHADVYEAMSAMDILLMPYQRKVSVGIKGVDTSKWMSPLKLFEYMSSGVPIISSKIEVLEEVLKNFNNSILVPPDDVLGWSESITLLSKDKGLCKRISNEAFKLYENEYNWSSRAQKMIKLLN